MTLRSWALAAATALVTATGVHAEPPPLSTEPNRTGYVTMADGTQLRYTVFLPAETGRFPTLLQYDAYAAGSNPDENGQDAFGPRMRARGYAVLGVNIRGSGCSGGTFDVFEPQWARDGYQVVEWAARQPWSDGRVGMFGVSLPAITSLYVAALRPPHLAAIAPAATLADLYRDVAYPGGMFNRSFAGAWTGLQKAGDQDVPLVVADDGDATCVTNYPAHNKADQIVLPQAMGHPYDDAFWKSRSLGDAIRDIDVPVLSMTSWQDEQVSSRVSERLPELDPDTSWAVLTNGDHGISVTAPGFAILQEAFFDHFLAGVANGFETTPHVLVWHETSATTFSPRWVSTYPDWPQPRPQALYLTATGGLAAAAPEAGGSSSYAYPAPSALVPAGTGSPEADNAAYQVPVPPALTFTTPALPGALELFGTASADLWVSSTASDTDLQVTLSEIRPDGQEQFVQRGWLRASHRALDTARSTRTRPYHPHDAASATPLTSGVPALLRIEIFPFDHVFRAGSRLRLTVESPFGVTGLRALDFLPQPAVDTVYAGGRTPSRLVVGMVPAREVPAGLAACGTVLNEPCRAAG